MSTTVHELEAIERLHEEFGFRYAELAQALNTTEPTLHRWRRGSGGEPTPVYLKRLEAFEAFLEELDALFARRRAAQAWLDKSLVVLKNRTPRQMIIDGLERRRFALTPVYALSGTPHPCD